MSRFEDPTVLVPLIFSALAFLTVIGLALPWLEPGLFATRLKVIRQRRDELSLQRRQRLDRHRPALRHNAPVRVHFMGAVLEKLNLRNIAEQSELKKKLVRAGWRGPAPLITFAFLRVVLPLGAAGIAALILFGAAAVQIAPVAKLLICLLAALVGAYLPSVFLSNAIARRQQDLRRQFPDALDLMVICVEAGLSLEAAFTRVYEEMGAEFRAICEELALTTAELAFLSDRRLALENLAERTGAAPIRSLVTALLQSERYGTPLGTALRVVSQESRDARMARAEEKAASLPAKLTVPMVAFFLPVLFMVLIGPTIIQVVHAFSRG